MIRLFQNERYFELPTFLMFPTPQPDVLPDKVRFEQT